MRLIIFNILTFILLFNIGCRKQKSINEDKFVSETNTIGIEVDWSSPNQIEVTSILDSIRYVKLQLTDQSIIGYIQKVVIHEDRIYILDTQTMSLLVFDINGNYIFKIAAIGLGPEEYSQIDFFDIDAENKQIVLTDLMGYWIMRFDLNGTFLSRKKIPLWGEGVAPDENKGAILIANFRDNRNSLEKNFNLFYLDSLMHIEKAYFPYDIPISTEKPLRVPSPKAGFFYYYENKLHFFPTLGNCIYQVTRNGLSPKYTINFGDKTYNILDWNQNEILEKYVVDKDYYKISTVLETNEYLNISFSKPSFPVIYSMFYSKKNGKILNAFTYINGRDPFLGTPPIAVYDSWFVSEVQIEHLIDWKVANEKNKDLFQNRFLHEKMEIAKSITLDDNPILKFYKFKSI